VVTTAAARDRPPLGTSRESGAASSPEAGVGNLGDGVVRSDMTGTDEPLATTDLEIRVQRRQRRLVE